MTASAWRPIETAPKDGASILLHCSRYFRDESPALECDDVNTVVASWWEREEPNADGELGDWICYMDLPMDPLCPFEPTHWMPLPDPPPAETE